jgi:hypothetical protein
VRRVRACACRCRTQTHTVVDTGTLLGRLPCKSSVRNLTRATASCECVFWTLRGQLGSGKHANARWVGACGDAGRRGDCLKKKSRKSIGIILETYLVEERMDRDWESLGPVMMICAGCIEAEMDRSVFAAWLISQSRPHLVLFGRPSEQPINRTLHHLTSPVGTSNAS